MNKEMSLLVRKHTDTLIEQTKENPRETLDFKLKKQMDTFSFDPPINLSEEGKWFLALTSFRTTNSVFNITDEETSFPHTSRAHWNSGDEEELITKLNELLELRSENDIELHVKKNERRGTRIEKENSGYNLARLDHFKKKRAELKRVNYKDPEDLV